MIRRSRYSDIQEYDRTLAKQTHEWEPTVASTVLPSESHKTKLYPCYERHHAIQYCDLHSATGQSLDLCSLWPSHHPPHHVIGPLPGGAGC